MKIVPGSPHPPIRGVAYSVSIVNIIVVLLAWVWRGWTIIQGVWNPIHVRIRRVRRRLLAGVAHSVPVAVCLVLIRSNWTIIDGVWNPVPVRILRLAGVAHSVSIVNTIVVLLARVWRGFAIIDAVWNPVTVRVGLGRRVGTASGLPARAFSPRLQMRGRWPGTPRRARYGWDWQAERWFRTIRRDNRSAPGSNRSGISRAVTHRLDARSASPLMRARP